ERAGGLGGGAGGAHQHGAALLSSPGVLDGRPAALAAGTGRRRAGGPVCRRARLVSPGAGATGAAAGGTGPLLAGQGVPAGTWNLDEEDSDVAYQGTGAERNSAAHGANSHDWSARGDGGGRLGPARAHG